MSNIYIQDHHWFQKALELAENGQHRVRVGAYVVAKGKPIAGAFNTYRNSPNTTNYGNATHHAEFNVVRLVSPRLLPISTLYVARLNQSDDAVPSKPCDKCMVLLHTKFPVNWVVYMNDIGHLVKERPR